MKTNLSNLSWTKIAALSCGLILVVGGTAAYAGGHGGGGHSGGGHSGGGHSGGSHSMGSHSMGSGQSSFRSSSMGHTSSKLSSSLGGSQFKKSSGLGQSGLGNSSARSGLGMSKNSGINGGNLKGKNTGIAGGLNGGKNSGKSGGLSSNKNSGIHGKLGQVSSHNHHGDHNGHKGNHDGHGKHHGDHNGHGKHHDHGELPPQLALQALPVEPLLPPLLPGLVLVVSGRLLELRRHLVNVVDVEQVVEVPVETVVTDAEIDLQLKNIELLDAGNPQAGQGPVYRITILNASDVAIETGFDVGLVVTDGQEPVPNPRSPRSVWKGRDRRRRVAVRRDSACRKWWTAWPRVRLVSCSPSRPCSSRWTLARRSPKSKKATTRPRSPARDAIAAIERRRAVLSDREICGKRRAIEACRTGYNPVSSA